MDVLLFVLEVLVYFFFACIGFFTLLGLGNFGKKETKYGTMTIFGGKVRFNILKGWIISFILTFGTFVFMMVIKTLFSEG